MKKKVLGIFAAVIFVGVGTTTVFAARPETGQNYVDADNNGVCDHMGTADCPNRENCSYGQNYVDANNDGVCDHAGTEDCKRNGNDHHVQRHGNGQQVRKGCGRNRK